MCGPTLANAWKCLHAYGLLALVAVLGANAAPAGFSVSKVYESRKNFIPMQLVWIDNTRALIPHRMGEVYIVEPNEANFPKELYLQVRWPHRRGQ